MTQFLPRKVCWQFLPNYMPVYSFFFLWFILYHKVCFYGNFPPSVDNVLLSWTYSNNYTDNNNNNFHLHHCSLWVINPRSSTQRAQTLLFLKWGHTLIWIARLFQCVSLHQASLSWGLDKKKRKKRKQLIVGAIHKK